MSARRAARAAAAAPVRPAKESFDWRDPRYGIPGWPPGADNPVSVHMVIAARRRARAARMAWEQTTTMDGEGHGDA